MFVSREHAKSSAATGTASVASAGDVSVVQELMNVEEQALSNVSGGNHDAEDHSSEHDLPANESNNARCIGSARVVR